jgi:hypothetical protein
MGDKLAYGIFELDERVGRKVNTHPVDIVVLHFDTREFAPNPRTVDRNSPEPNVVAVSERENASAGVTSL